MFEAYSVAVRVSLINGVTSGLLNISRAFAKTHGDAQKLQRQLDSIKFTMIAGAAVAGTGLLGLGLLGKTLPYAKEYTHQIQQMNIAGMKHAEIARSIQAAWAAGATVPTSTAAENLAAIRELRMVFGNTTAAIANMPAVQQLQAILANVKGVSNSHDEAYTVAKALEMKGAVRNPAEFRTDADMMAKAIVASGGKVTAQDFLGTFKYGRSATIGWSEHFAYEILPTLIQEMKSAGGHGGAGGPGNALMSVYDKVINGRIAQKDLPLWAQLGLLDPTKIVYTKTHSAKGVLPEAVAGWDLFQRDPYAWTQTVLMQALRTHGITDPAKQQMYLSRLGGTRTAAFMLQQMGLQGWKFSRDVPLIRGAEGLGAYQTLLKNDPMIAQVALQKQWQNLMAVIGYQIMPYVVAGTLKLVGALRELSNWMREHPDLTRGLVLGFAALSAALTFGGTVLLLKGAFQGLGLAIKVLQVGKLFELAKAITNISAVASEIPMVTGGVAAAPAAAATTGAGAAVAGVVGVVGVAAAAAYLENKYHSREVAYANAKRDLRHTSDADLKLAIDMAQFYERSNAAKAKGPHPSPFFLGIAAKARQQEQAFQGELNRRHGASPHVAPIKPQKSSFTGDVHMDGQKVGHVVWRHQADAYDRASLASSGNFDPGMTLAPTGLGYT